LSIYIWSRTKLSQPRSYPLKVETLVDLQKKVVALARIRVCLDGDADRIGLVDEKGKWWMLLLWSVGWFGSFANHPKAKMLYDVRSSMIIRKCGKRRARR